MRTGIKAGENRGRDNVGVGRVAQRERKKCEDCGCSMFVEYKARCLRLWPERCQDFKLYFFLILAPFARAICECAYQNHIKLVLC